MHSKICTYLVECKQKSLADKSVNYIHIASTAESSRAAKLSKTAQEAITSNSSTSSKPSPPPFPLTRSLSPLHQVKPGKLPTPDLQSHTSLFQPVRPAGLDSYLETNIIRDSYKHESYKCSNAIPHLYMENHQFYQCRKCLTKLSILKQLNLRYHVTCRFSDFIGMHMLNRQSKEAHTPLHPP